MFALVLVIIGMVNGQPQVRMNPFPVQFETFAECADAMADLVQEHGEPPNGSGLACIAVPEEGHDA